MRRASKPSSRICSESAVRCGGARARAHARRRRAVHGASAGDHRGLVRCLRCVCVCGAAHARVLVCAMATDSSRPLRDHVRVRACVRVVHRRSSSCATWTRGVYLVGAGVV